MTDQQFEIVLKLLQGIAEDIHWISGEGIPSGSFSWDSMRDFLKSLDRIATALEKQDPDSE